MRTQTDSPKGTLVHACPVCGSTEFVETQTVTYNHLIRLPVTDDFYIKTEVVEEDPGDSDYLDYACAKCGTRPPIGLEIFPIVEVG